MIRSFAGIAMGIVVLSIVSCSGPTSVDVQNGDKTGNDSSGTPSNEKPGAPSTISIRKMGGASEPTETPVFCGITDRRLRCETDRLSGSVSSLPSLRGPSAVVVRGLDEACAIDDGRLTCWGDQAVKAYDFVGARSAISSLSMGDNDSRTCAIINGRVRCWDFDASEQKPAYQPVPDLVSPVQVVSNADVVCAIEATGVKCWGYRFENGRYSIVLQGSVPKLSNPKMVSIGSEGAICAIADEGVKCWGNDRVLRNMPATVQAKYIDVGYERACVIDERGVQCWGSKVVTKDFESYGKELETVSSTFLSGHDICGTRKGQLICRQENSDTWESFFPNREVLPPYVGN